MNFLNFLNNKHKNEESVRRFDEAFKAADVDKAHELMLSLFRKKISPNVIPFGWFNSNIDDKSMRSFYFVYTPTENKEDYFKAFALNYLRNGESVEVYSISFFNETETGNLLWQSSKTVNANLHIDTLGTSVAYFIPIICHIAKNNVKSISKEEAEELGSEVFNKGKKNESFIWNYGAAKYNICENIKPQYIEDMFYLNQGFENELIIDEASEAQEYRWKKKAERDDAWQKMKADKSPESRSQYEKIQQEYQEVINAVRGGATTIDDIRMHIAKNKKVNIEETDVERQAREKFETEGKDPNQAFKEMTVYVKTVIKGLQPGVIICGAPGIGKTYKIMKQLEAAGYHDNHNMEVIKGKCTPRQLYLSLYNYKDKGNIVVIDDADALIGPKAPEDCINMLKAALDSTSSAEGRKVSYRVTGNILDDDGNEIPKVMYYKGGVIVITNYSVGQLDTALRGRTFVQELDFSNKQLLQIIEGMLDYLGDGMIGMSAKKKAFNYLTELAESGAEMEISIRTFNTCARLFAVCEDDPHMSDEDVKSMIKEQMKNQSLRGGVKF